MKLLIQIIYIISIYSIFSQIIPIESSFDNRAMFFQIKKSTKTITCSININGNKNFIPDNIDKDSKSKRQYKNGSGSKIYDDYFFLGEKYFIMKYYVHPDVKDCIISLNAFNDYSLTNILYKEKKIKDNGFGIKINKDNETKGMIFLGGFPKEETKGLYLYSYKYPFLSKYFSQDIFSYFSKDNFSWDLPVISFSIKTEYNIYNAPSSSYEASIDYKVKEILVPHEFYEMLHNNIMGNFINEKNCNYEYNNLSCNCNIVDKIKAFQSIVINIGYINFVFTPRDSFIKENNNKCFFIFKEHGNKHVILGKKFLMKFKIEFFQNKQINIYSETQLQISIFKIIYSYIIQISFIIKNVVKYSLGVIILISICVWIIQNENENKPKNN